MQTEVTIDQEISDLAERIGAIFTEALETLVNRRNRRYASEITALQAERETLAKEYACIEEAAGNLKGILSAKAREAQREADSLILAGKPEEAQAKLREAEEAALAPAKMADRQREISARVEAIQKEKRAIARRTFLQWHDEILPVIRAAEQGLFLSLLDGIERTFYDFQAVTETGLDPMNHPSEPGLFTQGHLSSLTCDERSAEWRSAQRWYGGRR